MHTENTPKKFDLPPYSAFSPIHVCNFNRLIEFQSTYTGDVSRIFASSTLYTSSMISLFDFQVLGEIGMCCMVLLTHISRMRVCNLSACESNLPIHWVCRVWIFISFEERSTTAFYMRLPESVDTLQQDTNENAKESQSTFVGSS